MVNHKSLLSVVCLLGLFFQYSSSFPFDSDSNSINDAELNRRTTPKVAGTSPNDKKPPAAAAEKLCVAPAKRGPPPKPKVWPAAKKSTSTSKTPPKSKPNTSKPNTSKPNKSKPNTSKPKKSKSTTGRNLNARDEELVQESEFNSTEVHQLNRRKPFPNGLPAVEDTPEANFERMTQILNDAATTNFFADGGYSNSFTLPTDADQQVGTRQGGLQGCTILISHNQPTLYFSHHWEVPGFNTHPPDYTKVEFDAEVKGFLTGAPGSFGDGLPLVAPGVATANQAMHRASTSIITVGSKGGFKSANYRAKINTIAELTTKNLEGTSNTFPYLRPAGDDPTVRVTAEFCAANRHLRVMISDSRSGRVGGYRVIDRAI